MPKSDPYEAEARRLAGELDRIHAEYALVPRSIWTVIRAWPDILNRAAQVAPFALSPAQREALNRVRKEFGAVVFREAA